MIGISVIVPAYQRISQTLKTVGLVLDSQGIRQRFDLEVIVADSSPNGQLRQALTREYTDKIVYTRPNKPGIATNKNQGARIASYPLLVFCDSDMEVEQDTLLKTLRSLRAHPTAAAVGGQVVWRGGPKDARNDRPRPEDRRETVEGTTYLEAIYSRFIATYKQVFWQVGGYDEIVFNLRGEGSDLSVRYWRAGYPLVCDEAIVVHHVYDSEGGIIRGVPHPEWGIAKDLLLLAYKYDMLDQDFDNFIKTVAANFAPLGTEGYFRIIQGIGHYLDFIPEVIPAIDRQKKRQPREYDFKFLEIFSNEKLFHRCIERAKEKLWPVRNKVW